MKAGFQMSLDGNTFPSFSPYRAHGPDEPADATCPCCDTAMRRFQDALRGVSGLVAVPLPETLKQTLGPALLAVRLAGRQILAPLAGPMPSAPNAAALEALQAAVGDFSVIVRDLEAAGWSSSLEAYEIDRITALRSSLLALATSASALAAELSPGYWLSPYLNRRP